MKSDEVEMSDQPLPPLLYVVKPEPCTTDSETDVKPCISLSSPKSLPTGEIRELPTEMAEMDDIEYYTIFGEKPYFDVIISKSHLGPLFQMFLPVGIVKELPHAEIPVVLTCCGKNWRTDYCGHMKGKRFAPSWREFAIDNKLKIGDGCLFELLECTETQIIFKVIILNGNIPLFGEGDGETPEKAILID